MKRRMKCFSFSKENIMKDFSTLSANTIYKKQEEKIKLIKAKCKSFSFILLQCMKKNINIRILLFSVTACILLAKLAKNVKKHDDLGFLSMVYADSTSGGISSSENLYDILELPRESTVAEVKKAYRTLSLKKHPDKVRDREEKILAQIKFQKINFAYNVLSDPENKKYYDTYGDDYEVMKEYFEELIYAYNVPELYAFKKHVTILCRKNYEKILLNSSFTWIVNFYHPNCESCQLNSKIIIYLAERVAKDDKFRVAAVNCGVSMELCHTFEIPHVGVIYFFFPNQNANDFWDYTLYEGSISNVEHILRDASTISRKKIEKITDESFIEKQLLKPVHSSFSRNLIESVWLLEYYKPGCAPCRQVKDELNDLAQKFRGTFKIAVMNCDVNICNVPYYPYLKLFIKRKGFSEIETHNFIYRINSHPALLAISVLGFLLKDVMNFQSEEISEEELLKKKLEENKINNYHYEDL